MLLIKGFQHLSRNFVIKSKLFKQILNQNQLSIQTKISFSSNSNQFSKDLTQNKGLYQKFI